MGVFRFELEPVLDQRTRVERDRQRAVAELERERLGLEDRIRGKQALLGDAKRHLRAELAGPDGGGGGRRLQPHGVRLQATASLHLVAEVQRLALTLAGVHKRLEAARALLLEATMRRKAVELLRKRRYDEWRRAEARREAAETDDIVTGRACRREPDSMEVGY